MFSMRSDIKLQHNIASKVVNNDDINKSKRETAANAIAAKSFFFGEF